MRNCKTTVLLLAGMALSCGVYAAEPAAEADTGMSGRIKAIDPATGKSRQPTGAEITALRARAATMKSASPLRTRLPKTHAEASRLVTVLQDGTEILPASEDSLSTVIQTRQADGTLVTGHAAPAPQAQEQAGE